MLSLNYFADGESSRDFFEPAVKIPLIYKRGMTTGSPLWQRGVRGDFSKIMVQLGLYFKFEGKRWIKQNFEKKILSPVSF